MIDDDKKTIEQYEQNNYKYRIWINYSCDDTSLEYKMEVMKMINEINVNQKVGEISIKLRNNNIIDQEIIRMMINNYDNVYVINVIDYNDSVDN